MNKIRKHIRRQIFHARHVLRQNSVLTYLRLKLFNILGVERTFRLVLHDASVVIRSATPDLRVALASLGREFDVLALRYPHPGGGLIIDAGGYIGTAAMALARIYPACTIVTIEPSSRNFKILRKNVKSFETIRPIRAALTPERGLGEIDLMSRGNGEWGFTTVAKPKDREARFLEQVETISIEDILERFGHERVLVLKMDIEGGEHAFFENADGWLERVDILLVELHDRIVPGCAEAFETANRRRSIIRDSGGKLISIRKTGERTEEALVA